MDLLSSIRKEGSRGGVDFKWSDVTTSQHRENYLGHSIMAPVGRWQKNRDLSWYAKSDSDSKGLNKGGKEETAEETKARERREEIQRIKEAEEDELAKALGLPAANRSSGMGTGANNIDVGEVKRAIKETEEGDDEIDEVGRSRGFGDFVGRVNAEAPEKASELETGARKGGLVGADDTVRKLTRPARTDDRSRSRSRSRSRDRRLRRHKRRDRSSEGDNGERHRYRERERETDLRYHHGRRNRSRSPRHPRDRRQRSRSPYKRDRSRSPPDHRRERERERYRSRSTSRRNNRDDRDARDVRDVRGVRGNRDDRGKRDSGPEYRGGRNYSRRSRSPDSRDRKRERESRYGGGGRERWR